MAAFHHRLAVEFSEVDHAGVVYHPVFFDYFHRTIEALLFERLGPRAYVDMLDRDRIGMPAVRSECEFRMPVRFGDQLDIEMSVAHLGRSSVTLAFRVYRCADEAHAERALAAEGKTVSVFVDMEPFRAVVIPDRLRAVFEGLRLPD